MLKKYVLACFLFNILFLLVAFMFASTHNIDGKNIESFGVAALSAIILSPFSWRFIKETENKRRVQGQGQYQSYCSMISFTKISKYSLISLMSLVIFFILMFLGIFLHENYKVVSDILLMIGPVSFLISVISIIYGTFGVKR